VPWAAGQIDGLVALADWSRAVNCFEPCRISHGELGSHYAIVLEYVLGTFRDLVWFRPPLKSLRAYLLNNHRKEMERRNHLRTSARPWKSIPLASVSFLRQADVPCSCYL
jgi:hypothetical protein